MALADKEVLYLKVPASDDTFSQVLNVELPKDSMLEDWQFRLLKASTYLAAFLALFVVRSTLQASVKTDAGMSVYASGSMDGGLGRSRCG